MTHHEDVPRKIEVERRKRIYAAMDIESLLAQRNLMTYDILPAGPYTLSSAKQHENPSTKFSSAPCIVMGANDDGNKQVNEVEEVPNKYISTCTLPNKDLYGKEMMPSTLATQHQLSLELFDDKDYDERTPEEWVTLSQQSILATQISESNYNNKGIEDIQGTGVPAKTIVFNPLTNVSHYLLVHIFTLWYIFDSVQLQSQFDVFFLVTLLTVFISHNFCRGNTNLDIFVGTMSNPCVFSKLGVVHTSFTQDSDWGTD